MKLLLVRPKNRLSLGVLSFVNVEPLELEYLAAVCNEETADYEIYDGSIDRQNFQRKYARFDYDAVVISGYINSIDTIKSDAAYIKQKSAGAKVIVGGVVAEVVPELLYSSDIDIIIHSGGFEPFRKLLQGGMSLDSCSGLRGICYREGERWIRNEREVFDIKALPTPDRTHFYTSSHRFRYLHFKPVAILKTSYSCPYGCNFCYCRKLNGGSYVFMELDQIITEIKSIQCENIWIVDDIFLFDRQRVAAFIERIKAENIKKQFIVYSRADFIVDHADLLAGLKEIGLEMVIVGLEAADNESLESYNKHTNGDMNRDCIQLLQQNGIECTGLFITGIDYRKQDFRRLRKWIWDSGLRIYTLSVFTPLPGTESYEVYKDRLISGEYSRYDFLHLQVEPSHLGRKTYYLEFAKVYIPYIRRWLKRRWRNAE